MYVKDLIATLKAEPDQERVLPFGFKRAHSYRGYYDQLAFEPARDVTIASMVAEVEGAVGKVFEGYKGGVYEMDQWTACWLANYGSCGQELGPTLVGFMLGKSPEDLCAEAMEMEW